MSKMVFGERMGSCLLRYIVTDGEHSAKFDSVGRIGSWMLESDAIQAAKGAGFYKRLEDLVVKPGSIFCEIAEQF